MAAKKRIRSSRRPPKRAANIPNGFRTVTPYLSVDGGLAALEFYKRALGAKEIARETTPEGRVLHARLQIGDSVVMLSDVSPGANSTAPNRLGTTTVVLHLYSDDVDALWRRAVGEGMRVVVPLENQYWGERWGQLVDPFGHHWTMAMKVPMTPEEVRSKREDAMLMLARGKQPAGNPEASWS